MNGWYTVDMNRRQISSVLAAEPSVIEGVARLMDFGGTLQQYNDSDTENEADARALGNDWDTVGNDIRVSISQYERGHRITRPA